ncbi:MAG TPA: TrmH family RNA methyltransferase [Thermoanaerobaculia bacterium]
MTTSALSIVLVRPQKASNLGSVARVAKNFGVRSLSVVEPAVTPDEESHRLAAGADDLLDTLARYPSLSEAVAAFPLVVTTSSLRGRARSGALELPQLPDLVARAGPRGRVAFVFGPERSGLTEEEMSRASACLRVPTDSAFPTLNLSHAVAVVLAVARAFRREPAPAAPARDWAQADEVEAAVSHWDAALDAVDFYDTGHRERSLRDWRKLIAGRPLTKREVRILRGVANRILVTLRRKEERF